MKVFLDFEASSLSDRSYPIEVAWVFEDERYDSRLIAPAPGWNDWDPAAEGVHGIARTALIKKGESPHEVATHMVEVLSAHELFASAPSWDGRWLNILLREAGLSGDALRLRHTDDALRETATEILQPVLAGKRLDREVHNLVARASIARIIPAHRALYDAREEHAKWTRARQAAQDIAASGK